MLDGLDVTSDCVQDLNFDFDNLLSALHEVRHSNDSYHIGETIIDLMKDVLRTVNVLTEGWDKKRRNSLKVGL
jgi:hypothetical protein